MQSHKFDNTIFKIAVAGIFLGLTILFQYLSKFMPLVPNLMNINLSLIFIVAIFMTSGPWYGILALITRFLFGCLIDGFNPIGLTGNGILLVAGIIFIGLVYVFRYFKFFNHKYGIYVSLAIITIIATLAMTLLNGFVFVPLYQVAAVGSWGQTISPALGVNSYWAVIFAVYITGNLIIYGITSALLVPLMKLYKWHVKKN